MRTTLLAFAFSVLGITAFSQSNNLKWSRSFSDSRTFIENKGQFDHFSDQQILFAIDEGSAQVLFYKNGYEIRLERKIKNENRKDGDRSQPKYFQQVERIPVRFVHADANLKVVPSEKADHYSTYAMLDAKRAQYSINGVSGFQKLTYENIYPNIDMVFTIHMDGGFKYELVLHPGADVSAFKLNYPSAYRPFMNVGDVVVPTTFGDIVDHAPIAFEKSSGRKVMARFKVDDTAVGFELGDYNSDEELIIDPWVQTPSFPNSGGIWDIDVDNQGNVYVYGGDTPMKLQKYDAAGALQWTYNTPWDSANYWIGTMITEPNTGDCFITASTNPVISRISTAGSPIWTATGGAFDEYWKLALNCDKTQLILGGTQLSLGAGGTLIEGYGYVFEIDMNNGSQVNSAEIAATSPGFALVNNPNEVRALCSSPNGKFYYMTLDTIGVFDAGLNLGYQDNHGYDFSYACAGYAPTNLGINAMAATTDYLYTHNGSVLDKRNIVNGSIIASTPIPNGSTNSNLGFNSVGNGGLEIDSCGNVYVGSTTGVYKFDSDLNQLGFQSTQSRVYDLAVNGAGEIVACGQGFVASLNLGPCARPKAVCLNCLELTPAGPFCPEDPQDTLIANPSTGTWSGPGIIDAALGIFDPAVADTGTHVIHFTPDDPLVCGVDSLIIEVNYCVDLQACVDSLGNISIPNGIPPYTWSETIDTMDCSACFPGLPPFIQPCSTPPGCAVQTTAVVEFSNDLTVAPTGNWPIYVEDSEGNTLQINSMASLPACDVGCFIVANLPDTAIACLGDSGQATVQVTGAIGNVTYSWNTTPEQTTQTAINLPPGAYYTVTVTDDSSCVAMDSVYVVEHECVGPIVCATPFGDMQADGVGPFAWYEYADSTDCSACAVLPGFPPCTFPPGCAVTVQGYQQFATGDMATPTGNWPVAVVDGAGDTLIINALADLPVCTQSCYLQVSVPDTAFTCFGQSDAEVTATVGGAFGTPTYTWNTTPVQSSSTATGLGVGVYVVTVVDDNACEVSDTVEIVQNPQITVQVSGTDSLCLGVTVGSATAAASGGSGNFTYSWDTNPAQSTATANSLSVGTYQVTATDAAGCTKTGSWTIEERPSVTVTVTSGGDVCPDTEDGTATADATNGSGPYTYSWNTTPAQSGSSITGLSPGDYQVTATDQDGCQGNGNVTIGAFVVDVVNAGQDVAICQGEQVVLTAQGSQSYYWIFEGGVDSSSITVSPQMTTVYYVQGTDANGCLTTDAVQVNVTSVPTLTIEGTDTVLCDVSGPVQLVAFPGGGTFSGDGITEDGVFDPKAAGDGVHSIVYSYQVTDNCVAHVSASIIVDGDLCDVVVPSIMNPNSSYQGTRDFCGSVPQNNVFSLPCLEWYPGNRVRIFDRWGRKLYDQKDYQLKPWDGGNHSAGVYYYIIEFTDQKPIKGFFQLVR
ncbi:MAG: hypothetical protein GC178_07920 [Flavobacteriales bacterium]|nr:hypothetical protein [Flavobacteriales bacterium]